MTISIHQPNFFPWLGFFDKILKADLFVYLDHVENNPRDSGWFKSVKILINGDEFWLTQPVKRPGSVTQPINEMQVTDGRMTRKNLKSIKQHYSNTPYFDKVFPLVENYFTDGEKFLAEKNINFIEAVCDRMKINTPRKRSSDYDWQYDATELLIEITKKFDGNTYMAGGGSEGYQEDKKFAENNIKLIYQNFSHPTYTQVNSEEFIPGLSIIDPLMNMGFDDIARMLKTY